MESPRERVCQSCSAPAAHDQRWCLECGAELPQPEKRSGLKTGVGIATALTVLVGAASAGGYTLLQDGKKPPPPAATIAQTPPPVTTPPVTETPPLDSTLPGDGTGGDLTLPSDGGGTGGGGGGTGGGSTSDDFDDLADDWGDTGSTGGTGGSTGGGTSDSGDSTTDDGAGDEADDDGSVSDDTSRARRRAQRPARPRLVPTDVALGAIAVVYPPSATGEDLGDAGAVVDGSPGSAWRTPIYEDPATNPQLGVYVELPSAERLDELVVTTPTPGMHVEVYAATSGPPRSVTSSGWSHVADKTLQGKSTIKLPGARYRYVLLWVTGLPPSGDHAAISGVRIISQQPE